MEKCNKTESTPKMLLVDDNSDYWTKSGLKSSLNPTELIGVYDESTNTFRFNHTKYKDRRFYPSIEDLFSFALSDNCIVRVELIKQYNYVVGVKVLEKCADSFIGNESLLSSLEDGQARTFPLAVQDEVKNISSTLTKDEIQRALRQGFVDMRKLEFVTIDGETTRDFDDGLYLKRLANGNFQLHVAIANVAKEVKPNSSVDQEALFRGNSIYYFDRVVPMIPQILSNGKCSLNPHEDRFAVVHIITICSQTGNVLKHQHKEAIIKSHHRLRYGEMDRALKGDFTNNTITEDFYNRRLVDFRKLTAVLCLGRESTSTAALSKDRVNSFMRQVNGNIVVAESMIVSNSCAGQAIVDAANEYGLYRVHLGNTADEVTRIVNELNELGIEISLKKGRAEILKRDVDKILKEVQTTHLSDEASIYMNKLLGRAYFSGDNKGHSALRKAVYSQITSPIRRYGDLHNQRVLVHLVIRKDPDAYKKLRTQETVAEQITYAERYASRGEDFSLQRRNARMFLPYEGKDIKVRILRAQKNGLVVRFRNKDRTVEVDSFIDAHTIEAKGFKWNSLCKAWMMHQPGMLGNTRDLGVLSLHKRANILVNVTKSDVFTGNIFFDFIGVADIHEAHVAA